MHHSTSQFFILGNFVSCHFYKWGTCQKNFSCIFLHDGVIRHSRDISPSGCSIAKYYGECRNTLFGSTRHLSKRCTVIIKNAILIRQISTSALHQIDRGQLVFKSNFAKTQHFKTCCIINCSTLACAYIGID